jgi:hypothetical protein
MDFAVEGNAVLVGPAKVCAEAGIASTLLWLPAGAKSFKLTATCRDVQLPTVCEAWSA